MGWDETKAKCLKFLNDELAMGKYVDHVLEAGGASIGKINMHSYLVISAVI